MCILFNVCLFVCVWFGVCLSIFIGILEPVPVD